jgi:hypothetical protein
VADWAAVSVLAELAISRTEARPLRTPRASLSDVDAVGAVGPGASSSAWEIDVIAAQLAHLGGE